MATVNTRRVILGAVAGGVVWSIWSTIVNLVILEPRYAMSMAMTVLSFAMLFHFAGINPRQLTAADLDPVKVWTMAEDRVTRVWERGMKYYQSLRVVFEIQSRLKEWTDDQPVAENADVSATPEPEPEGASSK